MYSGDDKSFDNILDETTNRQNNLSLENDSNDSESEDLFRAPTCRQARPMAHRSYKKLLDKRGAMTLKYLFEYAIDEKGFL